MFTGLVEQTGIISQMHSSRIIIRCRQPLTDPVVGESIAVNGCCLTAERFLPDNCVEMFTMAETLRRTNLGTLGAGAKVNIERAMSASGRLGGHIVQGHVDVCAPVRSIRHLPDGDIEFAVEMPEDIAPEIAMKGSVAIDGVSLTVSRVEKDWFAVRLIPQTLADTALLERKPGTPVNLETDVIAKYLRRQLSLLTAGPQKKATWNDLHEAGLL